MIARISESSGVGIRPAEKRSRSTNEILNPVVYISCITNLYLSLDNERVELGNVRLRRYVGLQFWCKSQKTISILFAEPIERLGF